MLTHQLEDETLQNFMTKFKENIGTAVKGMKCMGHEISIMTAVALAQGMSRHNGS